MKKKFPRKPFEYGKYLVEYSEDTEDILRFLKEKLDTIEEARSAREKLVIEGYYKPKIKKVG
tara:strand:+ start:1049 stop:1234 length:186 start_codon:yes stop_codon:yes gene_type:complete